jgi:hypothetical protein
MKTRLILHRWVIVLALSGGAMLASLSTASAQVTPGRYVGSMKITVVNNFDDRELKTSSTFKVQANVNDVMDTRRRFYNRTHGPQLAGAFAVAPIYFRERRWG